jgi:hypothetical protein
MQHAIVNPFYQSRLSNRLPAPAERAFARLPLAPRNASPVPHLTSLYHFDRAGEYGDRSYPGNCGGNLIKDLLNYFKPSLVFDPMTGSGTCKDVCKELGIPCHTADIRYGMDACSASAFARTVSYPFIWAHPPYWRQKIYTLDPRDLSQASTVSAFLERYGQFIGHCAHSLTSDGKLVILMGDYTDRHAGFVPLTYWTKHLAFAAGLKQHGTDIIRFSHGASSSKKIYRSSFIPGLHDVCMIFERPTPSQERTPV